MADQRYRATLNKGGQNRSVWCVIFRHPVRLGPDGKPGRRIRRSLGIEDETESQKLVDQANLILSDESWWSPSARIIAERTFDKRIVAAFYDDLTPTPRDGWAIRDGVISLPSPEDGYARVLLVGSTGAGKTTLLRQLIGTGSKLEKFPSISTAKTTTCDIEIITTEDGSFHAVVSFLPKDQVRQYVEECVCAAVLSYVERERESVTVRRFLEHSEQRFRLSYLLGTLSDPDEEELEDEIRELGEDSEGAIPHQDRLHLMDRLRSYLSRIQSLARASSDHLAETLNFSLEQATQEERDTFEELIEDHLRERDEFHELVDDILDDFESRFDLLKSEGEIVRDRGHWPSYWAHESKTADRPKFIRLLNRFSSNQAPQFGRLLTPLVEGIRVRGPFKPNWLTGSNPKLVLLDGEGLGHAASSATSLSTRITRRYQVADAILLVDSATQPMLAAPGAALRSIAANGQQSKLLFAFTHFDQVRGDNLRTRNDKEQHVLASLDNTIVALGKDLGRSTENALKRIAPDRSFFLSNIQDQVSEPPANTQAKHTLENLRKLLKAIEEVSTPPPPPQVIPIYDDANLILCVQRAVTEFREPWRARLGLSYHTDVRPEHWTRVKALTRRLGELGQDEYDTLRPVADFIARLLEQVRPFLETPTRWEPARGATDEMKSRAMDVITQTVAPRVHDLANNRIVRDHIVRWGRAYAYRGVGSGSSRSHEVEGIYNEAAPVPGGTPDPQATAFLREIRILMREAIREGGGKLEGLGEMVDSEVSRG
ncbi:hypothetical protein F183_A12520 [Bryobacterales bacterium F-183]|nr:hypothetical protein F183_A12520 [Bryobacterales bacterium F-183]